MKLEQFKQEIEGAEVFCEVGVYFYDEYCRLKTQIEKGKHVILVEPAPPCILDIEKNIKDRLNVTLYPFAIADEQGVTKIHFEGASAFIDEIDGRAPVHQRHYLKPNIPAYIIEKRTFNEIDPGNIDVLLIDTEGMEYFVLKWMKSRPRLIIVETHYQEYINPYLKEIYQWMQDNGYKEIAKDEADTAYAKI